jgi:carbohydrate kinase (thermoresistant glucokinase family)
MIVVVMGVSGAGKTRIGRDVATRLGWTFIEGDDLHTEANRQKMAAGKPLDDEDRWPWLDRLCEAARDIEADGGSVVIACSALKRAYRDRLRVAGQDVRFVHLSGDRAVIGERMAARRGHYMPPGLLDSQIATLEAPTADEGVMTFDVSQRPSRIVDEVAAQLAE